MNSSYDGSSPRPEEGHLFSHWNEFDPTPLAQLLSFRPDGRDMVIEIARQFLRDSEKSLAQLDQAIQENERQQVLELGHSLKGGAGSFGLPRLQAIGAEIEKLARGASVEDLLALKSQAMTAYQGGMILMLKYLEET